MTISNYIRQDLKSHIDAGDGLPYPLTLSGMAKYYDVSVTPVRAAVRALIEDKVLRKGKNGRLSVNLIASNPNGATEAVSKPLPPPDWTELIAHDLLVKSLRGDTRCLREDAMANHFGVSRTVIRQAFNRLTGHGLIEHVPRSGWRVRKFDESDMCAYLEIRETLELKALELAQHRLCREDLLSMLAGNPIPCPGEPVQLNNRIHRYLIDKSGNFYIQDFFDRHGFYYTLLFEQAALEAQVVAEMAEQHRQILEALLAQDWFRARGALVRHIRAQKPVMQKLLVHGS